MKAISGSVCEKVVVIFTGRVQVFAETEQQ